MRRVDKIKIDGVEARSALARWVYEGERTIIIDDTCDDADNGESLFCNQSVKTPARQLEKVTVR